MERWVWTVGTLVAVWSGVRGRELVKEPPVPPGLKTAGVGEDHVNVTWIPGAYDDKSRAPIGNNHYVKYRVKGANEWDRKDPEDGNFTIRIGDLYPGTTYEVVSVSVVEDKDGNPLNESSSEPFYITTAGEPPSSATAAWLIALIVAIIIMIILLILICLVVRNRGAKYPVSEKEREQGREPMLGKEEKGFGEYSRPEVEDEKRSLTGGSVGGQSETDSMAEFGDPEQGNYNEDGSFIGVRLVPVQKAIQKGKFEGQYVNTTTAINPRVAYTQETPAGQKKSSTFV